MAERDLTRPGGWSFRPGMPIVGPLDYVVQVGVPAGDAPITLHLVFTQDGLYVPAVVRQPPGPGPFPAVICMHGGSGGLGIAYLVDQMLHRGMLFDRLLAEGYLVCYTEGRQEMEDVYDTGSPAVLDHQDLIAVFRYIQRLPQVDPQRVGFFGVSHGGELQMKLITELGEGPAALVPGEPAVIEYLGLRYQPPRTQEHLQFNGTLEDAQIDLERAWQRIQRISPAVPILILGRERDHLQGLFRKLYELLQRAGKQAYWESWDHPNHAYQWGPRRTERVRTNHEGVIIEVVTEYQADAVQQATLERVVAFLNQHVRDRQVVGPQAAPQGGR